MTHPFPIQFLEAPSIDRVTVALAPTDAFTGRPVRRGVSARLLDDARTPQPYRAIRSASGYLVFVNLPDQANYSFEVDATSAGYFGPLTIDFTPAPDGDPRPARERLRRVVWLQRRPDAAYDQGTTLVRGAVVRGPTPAAGVQVSVVPPAPGDPTFSTMTDVRGAFALALRLPALLLGDSPAPVAATLRFVRPGAPSRELSVLLLDGKVHVFSAPIDLDGVNEPPFAS